MLLVHRYNFKIAATSIYRMGAMFPSSTIFSPFELQFKTGLAFVSCDNNLQQLNNFPTYLYDMF